MWLGFACCLRFNRWVGTWQDEDLTEQLNIQGGMMTAGRECVQCAVGNGQCQSEHVGKGTQHG